MDIRDQRVRGVSPTVPVHAIKVGTVFEGCIKEPSIYLRHYAGVVDLRNPRETWSVWEGDTASLITVSYYRPLDTELVIKGELA